MTEKIIEIDLNNFHPSSELLGEFTINKVQVTSIFTVKEVNSLFERIGITDVSIPTSLHLRDPNNFITIKSNTLGLPALPGHDNVPVHTNGIKFSIEADISKIENVVLGVTKEKDTVQEIPISFIVSQECKKHKISKKEPYVFKLLIKPAKSELKVEYEPLVKQFEYEEQKQVHIGNLNFSLKKRYGYFYHESFRAALKVNETVGSQAIEIDLKDIHSRLISGRSLTIPVYCNTSHIDCPIDSMPVTAQISIIDDHQNIISQTTINTEVLPDSTRTEIKVELADEDILVNGVDYQIVNNVRWLGVNEKGTYTCFELVVSNLAESGAGLIKVRKLKMNVNYDETKIELTNDKTNLFTIDGSDSFTLQNGEKAASITQLTFRHDDIQGIHGKAINVMVPLEFEYCITKQSEAEEKKINELYFCMNCYRTEKRHVVRLKISEDTICPHCGSVSAGFQKLTSDGGYNEFNELLESFLNENSEVSENNLDWSTFKSKILFTLEENTGDTWLAIDFGTSASVVALAGPDTLQRGKDKDIFINMNEALLKLHDQKYHEFSFGESNESNIISSEILFRTSIDPNKKTFLESKHYHEDVIQISPPKEILVENSAYSVPYLKSLIGFDTIPDINGKYQTLEYYVDQNQEKSVTFAERPLTVREILKNVYNSFLRDFIKPQLNSSNKKQLKWTDKIIFSVPNTFTPKQVGNIKSIIEKHFTGFKPEYVSFISESDAVACEYISNWNIHNKNRPDKDEMRQKDEYVMVYDVGAGTTDITLFKISWLKVEQKRELKILGKMGKGTAGNYLDYVIATIIDDMNQGLYKMTDQKGFNEIAHANKDFIKSFIKPNLQRPDLQFYIMPDGSLSEEPSGESTEIYIGAIVDHELMEHYLKANSTDIIKQFFNLFSGIDPFVSAEQKQSMLHTIIFSGRGVLFEKLRLRLENALRDFIMDDYQPYVIFNNDPEKLKSVVVKGALNYAVEFRNVDYSSVKMVSRNLMARYGFLYKNPIDGLWEFLEVLNPSTGSISFVPNDVLGLSIYEYDTKKKNAQGDPSKMTIDLSNTPLGYFVQSYSTDTAGDFNDKNWDYITIMFTFSKIAIANKGNINRVPVRVRVNRENQMSVTVGREEKDYRTPLKIDFASNITFKKSLWPYV